MFRADRAKHDRELIIFAAFFPLLRTHRILCRRWRARFLAGTPAR